MAVSNRDDRTFSTPIVLNFFLWFKYTQFPLPERIKEKYRTSTNLNPVFEIKIHKKRTINDSFESWFFPISFLEGEPIWTLFFRDRDRGGDGEGQEKKKRSGRRSVVRRRRTQRLRTAEPKGWVDWGWVWRVITWSCWRSRSAVSTESQR